jgi:parallel beta-helix repeat protein
MAYKRYIKRGKKIYGPYVYHSRKEGNKVVSEYKGKPKKHKKKNLIFFIIGLLVLSFIVIFIQKVNLQDSSTGFIISEVQQDQLDETQIILGKSVKWKKYLSVDSPDSFSIKIPEEAEKIKVKKLDTENIILSFIESLTLTGRVIDNENNEIILDEFGEYEINYETPAPYAVEEDIENGKRVKIIGPETIHYENVLSFTTLDENLNIIDPSQVKIRWVEQNTFISPQKIEDKDSNGIYDYVEWFTSYLSEQTFDIIVITKAEHLDSNREFISDIYEEVKALDNIWSETIPTNDYIRVTFEQNLDSSRDITIYPRVVSGNPRIEVYEIGDTELITEFTSLNSNQYNKVFLTNLVGIQDTFDLRVIDGSIEVDYIVDPAVFNDTFTDTDDTTLIEHLPTPTGTGWTRAAYTGSNEHWSLLTNQLKTNVEPNDYYLYVVNDSTSSNEYNVSITLVTTASGVKTVILLGRYTDIDNTYAVSLSETAANSWFKVVIGGTPSTLNTTAEGVSSGDNITLEITNSIKNVWKNGVVWMSSVNNSITDTGKGGLGCGNYLGGGSEDCVTTWALDDFVIEEPSAPSDASPTVTLNSPEDNANFSSTINFNCTAQDDIKLENVSLYGNWTGSWLLNETNSTPVNATPVIFSKTISDGTYLWSCEACDNATTTQCSFATPNRTFTVDSTPPTITLPVYTNATQYRNDQSMIFNVSVSDSGIGASYCSINVAGNTNQTVAVSNGWCNGTYALTGIGDGNQTINAYANDTLGNTDLNNSYVVWIDTTVPTVTLPVYTNATAYKSSDSLIYNISVSDAGVGPDDCTINVDTASAGNVTVAVNNGWCNGTYSLVGASDGNQSINAYANDTLGNTALNNSYVVNIDGTAPTIALPVYTNATQKKSTESLTLNISVSDSGSGPSACVVNVVTATASNQTIAYSNGWCNGTYSLAGASDGNQTINVYANDTLNNFGLNNSYVVWIDDTGPTITLPVYTNATSKRSSDSLTYNISVSDSGAGPDDCTINVDTASAGNVTVAVNNGWCNGTYSLVGASDGNQSINAYANDTLGNTALNDSYVVWIDSTPPYFTDLDNQTSYDNESLNYDINASDDGIGLDGFAIDDTTNFSIVYSTGVITNITTLIEYYYVVNVSINDTLGNLNWSLWSLNVTETPDITAPTIQVQSPTNTSYSTSTIWFNATADESISTWIVNYNGTNVTHIINTSLEVEDGNHQLLLYANDSSNNFGLNDSIYFTVDTTDPIAAFGTDPIDNYNSTSQSVTFDLNCSDNLGMGTLQLWGNWTGTWHANQTNSSPINATTWSIQVDNIPEGAGHVWGVWCNDSLGNENITGINRTFTVDATGPTITLPVYNNATQYRNDQSMIFNILVSDAGVGASYCNINVAGNVNQTLAVSNGWCNGTYALTGIGDGNQTINAYANDTLGNTALNNNYVVWIDTTKPTITHDSPANGTYFSYAPYFNGTCTDSGVGLDSIYTNLTEYPGVDTSSPYNFTNTSALTEGIYSVRISCNDTANNTATSDFYFTFDRTNPTAIINAPATNANTTDNTPDINITLTDNIGSAVNYTFYINDTVNKTGVVANGSAINITMDTLADSLYRIKIQATDNASNSANSSEILITIDTTTPQFSNDGDDSGGSVVEGVIVNTSVYWQDSGVGLDTAIFRNNISGWANVSTCSLSGANGWCNKTIDTAGQIGKNICWNQYANDTLGNLNASMSQAAHCFSVTAPNVGPYSLVINDIDGNLNNSYTNDTEPEINFTVLDKEQSSLSCELWVNGSVGYGYNGSVLNDTATILSINQTLTNSLYTVYVNCSDGSLTNSSAGWWFTVDTINPQINIDYPSNNSNLSITQINITGTASDASPGSVVINDSRFGTNQGSYASWNFTNYSLVEETYIVKITANDSAGNKNSSVLIFTVDRTNPVISHDSPTNNSNFSYAPYFNGTCSDAGVGLDSIYTNLTEYPGVDTSSPYNFTNTSALTEGIYSARISCNDSANNTATSDFYFTFDITNPTVNLNLPEDDFNTSSQIINFNFTAIDNISSIMNCSLYMDDIYQQSNASTINNTLTNLQETGITEGSHNYTIKCKDSAQNEGTSATRDFYVDLTDPTDNNPTDESYLQNSGATIDWFLTDDYASGYYYVEKNSTIQNSSTAWSNNTNLSVWINTTTLGAWNYTIFYNDSVGNSNSDEVIITISSDNPPTVTLNSPVDYYNSTLSSVTFNCTADDDVNLINVSLYGNWSGWHLNETNSTPIDNVPVIFGKTISDGSYIWNCYACDSISQCDFASANRTFSIDTIKPLIEFTTGTETNNTLKSRDWIFANVSVTEDNFENITYRLYNSTGLLNQTTYTSLVTSINWTGLNNNNVQYWYNVSVYDKVGNFNQTETRYITLDIITDCKEITTSGTYDLANEINSSLPGFGSSCIKVTANDVIIDCKNYAIRGDDLADQAINISRSSAQTTNVTLKNCEITNWDTHGIYLSNSNGNTFENLNVSNNPDRGINLFQSDSNTISDSTTNSNTIGIYLDNSHSNNLENVTSNSNTQYGIYFNDNGALNTISNSTINSNSQSGILVYNTNTTGNTIENTNIKNNTQYDIEHWQSSLTSCNTKITNVTGTDDKPIVYYNSSVNLNGWNNNASQIILCNAGNSVLNNITMSHTDVENNGLFLFKTDASNITNSVFNDSYNGITFILSDDGFFTNITANSNTQYGLSVIFFSARNTFTNITTNSNSVDGIRIAGNSHKVRNSNIEGQSGNSDSGISINSDHNILENNTIKSNYYGVYLESASDNTTITNNTFESNSNAGIYLDSTGGTTSNLIYNNLLNNTNNAVFAGTTNANSWNTTQKTGNRIYSNGTDIGGNYWTNSTGNGFSDTCTDTDTDGFCDSGYNITNNVACTIGVNCSSNTDFLALSDKFGDAFPTVSIIYPENITYNTDVTQLNYTASDDNSLSACWYSTNRGASNSSADPTCANFTGLISSEGSNNWTVYVNDSAGQENSSLVIFTKDTINPIVSIVYPQNINYTVNVSQLNYTYTETNPDKCWWSNSSGAINVC